MEIRTRVREVRGERIRLVCEEEPDHCDLCVGSRGCSFGSGATGRRSLDVALGAEQPPLQPGDLVLVSVDDVAIVRAAAVTYLLPVAGLLAGALLAQLAGMGDGMVLLTALGGALACIWHGRRTGARRFRVLAATRQPTDRYG